MKITCIITIALLVLGLIGAPGFMAAQELEEITLYGTITAYGQGLPDAKLQIEGQEAGKTNQGGDYKIIAHTRSFNITAYTADNAFIGQRNITVEDEIQEMEINFTYNPMGIHGTVTENSVPLSGVQIYMGSKGTATTDSMGFYQADVQAGMVTLYAVTKNGEFIGEKITSVTEEGPNEVNFNFIPATVTVTVTGETPVYNAKVIIGRNNPIRTGVYGTCSQKAAPGKITIYVRYPDGRRLGQKEVTLIAGEELKVEFTVESAQ